MTSIERHIRVGRGWRDSHHAQDRRAAQNVAAQMAAAGRWSAATPITIHEPFRLFHSLGRTPRLRHDAQFDVDVRAGVYDLQAGVDFDIETPRCEGYDRASDPATPPRCTRPATTRLSIFHRAGDAIQDGDRPDGEVVLCARCLADYYERAYSRANAGPLTLIEEALDAAPSHEAAA